MKPKVGLISFSDLRAEVYEVRKAVTEGEITKLTSVLVGKLGLSATGPVRVKSELLQALAILRRGVERTTLHVPIFTPANLVVMAARLLDVPVVVVGNVRVESHSTVGYLGCTGGISQVGLKHEAVLAATDSGALANRVFSFCTAASAFARLRGPTLGVFGGRGLGITIAGADPVQRRRLFGVDIEDIDQGEIVRRAQEIPDMVAERHKNWLAKRVRRIEYTQDSLTDATLKDQVKSYLATQEIIQEVRLNFIAITCQTYLGNYFALQCRNCTLNNDPCDIDGKRDHCVRL